MAHMYPTHVKSQHINMPIANSPAFTSHPVLYLQHLLTPYKPRDHAALARAAWFANEGMGYNKEQSTRPQTLAYGLADSPVGLLAWILEKLHEWTDDYPWTDEEICTWVSIYQFSTAGVAANLRIYYEATHAGTGGMDREKISQYAPNVLLGVAHFPKELRGAPKSWIGTLGPVVYQSVYEKGGHFAAWERPDAIVKDVRAMWGKDGPAFGCVGGRTGYSREGKL